MPISRHWRLNLVLVAGVAASYLALAWVGYALTIRPAGVSLWPPSGLMLGALLLLDRERWPAALLGGFLGNFSADLINSLAVDQALAGAAANALETVLAAALLRRVLPRPIGVGTLREVGWLVLGAAVASNAVSALGGAWLLHHWGGRPFPLAWLIWWVGDGMGMLIVTPVVLSIAAMIRDRESISRRRLLEAVVVMAVVALVAGVVLERDPGSPRPLGGYPYFAFPPLFWAAIRFGPWGASLATLVLGAVTLWNASHSPATPIPSTSVVGETLEIFSFLALASVSALVPAAILNEHNRAERRLKESEERFRQMAEAIQEAFFVVDLRTRTPLYVSPVWSEIWGRPIEDAVRPEVWLEGIVADDRGLVETVRRRVIDGQATGTTFRVIRPDGATRWVRGRVFPVRNAAGEVYRMVGVAEDITDLRRTENQLAHAQKMESVGRLAGGIAHDFNNLLTVILGETDLLKGKPGVRDVGAAVEHIRGAAERATSLTRQLLAFSRRQVIAPTVFDMNELIVEAGTLLRRLLGEHIDLDTRPADRPALVRADRGQIEQVITNLAVNARDAMPDGGMLTIDVGIATIEQSMFEGGGDLEPRPYVVLAVSDTGTGMTEAEKARIFEPFFTTKAQGQGTGLGLSTSYGIAQQSGGQLTAYSELGVGSTFKLYLPLVAQATEPDPSPAAEVVPSGTGTILLVEDEPAVRRVTARMLRTSGYDVLEAEDAVQAKEVLASHRGAVDLLLTDVVLPGQGGRALADEIRGQRPQIRILFMSGYTNDAVLRHRLLEHHAQLLQKPFTRDALLGKVRELLR